MQKRREQWTYLFVDKPRERKKKEENQFSFASSWVLQRALDSFFALLFKKISFSFFFLYSISQANENRRHHYRKYSCCRLPTRKISCCFYCCCRVSRPCLVKLLFSLLLSSLCLSLSTTERHRTQTHIPIHTYTRKHEPRCWPRETRTTSNLHIEPGIQVDNNKFIQVEV